MKKICVFFESKKIMSTHQFIIKLVDYLTKHFEIEAELIITNIENISKELCPNIKIRNDFDFDNSYEYTFITTTNYLFNLISRIENISSAKILCFFNYPQALRSLVSQIEKKEYNIQSLLDLLESSCVFINKRCFESFCKIPSEEIQNKYVFESVDETEYPSFSEVKNNSERYSIAWFGSFTENTLYPFQSLLENLKRSKLNRPIDIHIIGDGKFKWNTDFSKYSPQMRFIFVPLFSQDKDTIMYIQENVDLVVSYGMSAIKSSIAGVPTVITPFCKKKYNGDYYTYFFETQDGIIDWDENEIWNLGFRVHSIVDIIKEIYLHDSKQKIGKRCREHCVKYHSMKRNAEVLLERIHANTLTVSKCLDNDIIRYQIQAYKDKRLKDIVQSYEQFQDLVFTKKKVAAMEPAKKFIYYIEKILKSCYKNVKPLLKDIKRSFLIPRYIFIQKSYTSKIRRIRKKIQHSPKIKVAFILVFSSVFPTRPIFEQMLKSDRFDPYIIVAPNISRSHQYQMEIYLQAYNDMSQQYPGRVIEGYNETYDEYYELKDDFGIVFFCNPYPKLVHKFHSIDFFLNKDVLTVYANYGFAALNFWDEVIASDFYNKVWCVCVETEKNLKYLKKHQPIHGVNGLVTGYLKMDKLSSIIPLPRQRKRIIISPHHTVWGWNTLDISNFLNYYDFFLELPNRYPDIDFVFRPHPLLFPNLLAHNIWDQKRISQYIQEISRFTNMTYDTSSDYFDQFVNSDAIIHDCGSFIGEYLYTEKPCCYMLKSKDQIKRKLLPLGQACMANYYHAFSKEDIIHFIDEVVIKGNDPMKMQRERFVNTELKINYPYAAKNFIKMLEVKLFR